MQVLYCDTETYSDVAIRNGVYKYSEGVEIMLFAFAWNDDAPTVVDFTAGEVLHSDVLDALRTGETWGERVAIVFHNSSFDRTQIRVDMGIDIPTASIVDTMPLAYLHSLPGSLGGLSKAFNLGDSAKMDTGKRLINLFCKPQGKNRKLARCTRHTHPAEWAEFKGYAGQDIVAMRELLRKLPRWNWKPGGFESKLWQLDQRINDRGYQIDTALVDAAVVAATKEKRRLAKEMTTNTAGEVEAATQRARLKRYLADHGVDLPDMKSATLTRRLEDENLPWALRALIANRLEASMTSVAKYNTLQRITCADGRVRGSLQYCGAGRTGRWAGRMFQPQNLTRVPQHLSEMVNDCVDAVKGGFADIVQSNTMQVLSACIRGAIIAAPGKKLVVADLASIEGRVLAWLAGEKWKIKAYREFDAGVGAELYALAYARSFGVTVEEIAADKKVGGQMRQIGKVQELALGYQGAVGAFASMAEVYGLKLVTDADIKKAIDDSARAHHRAIAIGAAKIPEILEGDAAEQAAVVAVMLPIVKAHRKANAKTTKFWYALQDAVVDSYHNGGKRIRVGHVVIDIVGSYMRIELPSGRFLCYPSIRVDGNGKISYFGPNTYTRQWERVSTYGGKLAENLSQAVARDVFAVGLMRADDAGYEAVMQVHDETVTETPDTNEFTVDGLCDLLTQPIDWAPGLPLAADGYESKRYRK